MTIVELQKLFDENLFDHATYRDQGTLWEGLWIYKKNPEGLRGFTVVGSFPKDSPDLDAAFALCRDTGISVGAYGQG